MNNLQYIRTMPIEELAEFLLEWDDWHGKWRTHSCDSFEPEEKNKAIQSEVKWLLKDVGSD